LLVPELKPNQELEYHIEYQTEPVKMEINEMIETLSLRDLLPEDAFDIRVDESIEPEDLTITKTLKEVTIYHDSSLHYHNISVIIPVNASKVSITGPEEQEKIYVESKNQSVNITISKLSSKTLTIEEDTGDIKVLNLTQQKAEIEKPVEWSMTIAINNTNHVIDYKTPAPWKNESITMEMGKLIKSITIGSSSSVHYSNVISYTSLLEPVYNPRLFWFDNGTRLDVTNDPRFNVKLLDTNNNSYIDRIEWIVPYLSEQEFEVEADITILNVQSYPIVGGNWTVRFNTTGVANLTITPIFGTSFTEVPDSPLTEDDLEFLELRCGDILLNHQLIRNGDKVMSIFYPDYQCNETGYATSKVLTSGKHILEFRFGDQIAHAHNLADCVGTDVSPCHMCDVDAVNVTIKAPDESTSGPHEMSWSVDGSENCNAGEAKTENWTYSLGYTFCPAEGDYNASINVHAEGDTWDWEESSYTIDYNPIYTVTYDTSSDWCGCKGGTWLSEGTGTGSDCCGDDAEEDWEQAEADTKSCCYNAAELTDESSSGSILCHDGQAYDCNSQVSFDGNVDTEDSTGQQRGSVCCGVANDWTVDACNAAQWSDNKTSPSSPATYSSGASYQFNVTWTDDGTLDTVLIEHNLTGLTTPHNDSFTGNNGGEYYFDVSDLAVGTYVWRSYANDTTGATENVTDQWTYIVNKADPTANMVLTLDGDSTASQSRTYPNATNIQSSESNSVDGGCSYTLLQNGTTISNGAKTLAADSYNFTYNTSGCTNFTAGQIERILTVNKGSSSISISFLPSSSETYGTETTATCSIDTGDSTATLTLYRNGTEVASGSGQQQEVVTLGAGVWNYTCIYSESQNYTSSSSVNNYLTIAKATPQLTLSQAPSGTWSETYETQTDVEGTESNSVDSGCDYYLYRNNSLVVNSETITLGAGTHNYTYNTSGCANYTSNETWRILTITPADPTSGMTLTLDGDSSSPQSRTYPNATNIQSSESNSVDGGCSYLLAENGTEISNGAKTLAVRSYNFTYNTFGCTNFTSGQIERILTVNKGSSVLSVLFTPDTNTTTYPTAATIQCNITTGDSGATLTLFRNGSSISSGAGNRSVSENPGGGLWNYTCTYTASENYTASSSNDNWLTVSKASSAINLLLNGTDGDKPYNVSDIINSTIEITTPSGTSDTVYLDTNITDWSVDSGSSPHENMTSISTVGKYNFTGYWDGDENYTESSETHYVTIIQPGYLEVLLVAPPSTLSVTHNQTFSVNVTVYCRNTSHDCGSVQGTVQYNGSSAYPDTAVNITTEDKPLFVQGTPQVALKECPTNPLSEGEYCNLTWTINASGAENSQWEVGVLFNSTASGITDNHTDNSTITITHCSCDITLWSASTINFGTLNPNQDENAAPGNSDDSYNISVNQGSCTSNLWIRGEDLTNTTYGSSIGIGNLTWSNATDNYATSQAMTTSYVLLNSSVSQLRNATTYYWLNTPIIYAGIYKGNVTIFANESGS